MKPAVWRIFQGGRWNYADQPSTRHQDRPAWQPLYASLMASDGEGCAECGKKQSEMTDKEAMQLALDALMKWQRICLAKSRAANELTIPTKAIFALTAALSQDEPK